MKITVMSRAVALAAGYTFYDGIIPGMDWYVLAPDNRMTLRGFESLRAAVACAESYNAPFSVL